MTHPSLIIWTMARTGGTNFSESLLPLTPFDQVLHEPFNQNRLFGSFLDENPFDTNQVREKLAAIFATPRFIKFCVDAVPAKMVRLLVQVTQSLPVVHLFLYREDALARLLSKWFALNTGLWSADLAHFKQITGANDLDTQRSLEQIDSDFYRTELPIDQLVLHERFQRDLLNQVYQTLQTQGACIACLGFEDLYERDLARAKKQVIQVLSMMNEMRISSVSDQLSVDEWLTDLRSGGDQAMRDYYRHFSNLDDLKQAVVVLPPFLGQLQH